VVLRLRATRPGEDTPQYNLVESDLSIILTSKNQRCASVKIVEYTIDEPATSPGAFWHVSISPAASQWGDNLLWGSVIKPISTTTESVVFYLAERQLTSAARVGEQPKPVGIDESSWEEWSQRSAAAFSRYKLPKCRSK
jgi:hypothetical protein